MQFKTFIVIWDTQVLSSTQMTKTYNFLENDVASLKRIDPLNLPTGICKKDALFLSLNIDSLLFSGF